MAKEASDADQSRPSDSIKTEEPGSIEVGGQGGKDTPDPLKLDNSLYDVQVVFTKLKILSLHEDSRGFVPGNYSTW